MHQMGGGWLTFRDLSIIGAGQYKALQYALPDLVKDGLVDEVQTARKNGRPLSRYKINNQGTKVLQVAEAHVLEEYEKAVGRIDTFRNKWDIKSQAR
jgi:DNA-binding PadR family transcriptional regulator